MAAPSPPTVPIDISSATAVVTGAYGKFARCALTYDFVSVVTYAIIGEEEELQASLVASMASWPPQLFGMLWLLVGAALLFVGFALIRPINFVTGTYISSSIVILLLTLFAPSTTTCGTIVWMPVVVGLSFGALCAWKRGSMFAVIGLIVGEIVGRLFYNLTLGAWGAPDYLAYSCIGFFSVVFSCMLFYVGDFTWTVACAVGGAFLVIQSLITLVVLPISPESALIHFVEFQWPDITELGNSYYNHEYLSYLTGDAGVYMPWIITLILAGFGMQVQVKLLAQKKERDLMRASQAASLEMK